MVARRRIGGPLATRELDLHNTGGCGVDHAGDGLHPELRGVVESGYESSPVDFGDVWRCLRGDRVRSLESLPGYQE